MANIHNNLGSLFKDIADAIRFKTETTDPIPAIEFPEKIRAIRLSNTDLFVKIAIGEVVVIEASDIKGLTTIPEYAFTGCNKLETVNLPNTITYIDIIAFYECTNIKNINVPWAEGYIEGAPWGAINATITYNYGG